MANKKDQPKGLKKALRSQFREELKAEMELIEQQSSKKIPIKLMSKTRLWMGIVAGILLLIAAYFLVPFSSTSHEDLVAAYFSPIKNFSIPIERGASDLTLAQAAFLAYESNEFEEAVQKFEVLPNSKSDPNIGLFYAISLMSTDQYESAIQLLQGFLKAEQSGVQIACNWYLALAYLQTGKKGEAKKIFEELQSNTNPYQERAGEILERL